MPKLPASIGKYKVTERLGRGGMGMLYKAEHPTLGTSVVLKKLMLKGDNAHRERFRREAALMMRLRHENVVGIYDHFKEGAAYYLVMEYVDGRPLSELAAREGALPPDEAAWLIGRVALALAHIHENGIVHRDLKPSNIFLARDGSVKLGDFGIAFSPGDSDIVTEEGTALGTPSFMAPEQLVDARQADERSDIWSLGVCFFELITALKFVTGPTPAAILEALPEAVRNIGKKLPEKLPRVHRRFLRKSLRLRPEARMSGGAAAVRMMMADRLHEAPPALKTRINRLTAAMDSSIAESPREEAGKNTKSRKPLFPASLFSPAVKQVPNREPEKHSIPEHKNSKPPRSIFKFGKPKPRAAALILIPLVFLLAVLVVPGLWDELARSNRFGRLRLAVDFPQQAPSYWLNSVKARIYRWDDGELVDLANPVLRPTRDETRLVSRPISLPAGAYRLSWSLGDRIVWQSFHLGTIRENRAQNRHPFILEETLGTPPVFRLDLNVRAYDAMTEEELPARVSWERLDKPGGDLESGGRYRFTLEAAGYGAETFTAAASPWRREITLQTALWPLPGTVRIRNLSLRRIMPRLDGKRRFLDLTGTPRLKPIGPLPSGEELLLTLLPETTSLRRAWVKRECGNSPFVPVRRWF